MSAPFCFITSCGETALPADFDTLSPDSVVIRPHVPTRCYCDRHAPEALARDAPVGAILDHQRDPLLAPLRVPLNVMNLLQGLLTKALVVHRDEPLLGRAEDHRVLAAPAVRVRVRDRLAREEDAAVAQQLDDLRVRFEDLKPCPVLDVL